jgi:hypothetical protein
MATRLVPQLWQVLDANGNPGNGFKLYFYATGTSNLKDTYSDTALSVANANPVICNSDGHPANGSGDPISVWGVNKEDYKVILKDASDNTILTEDPIDTISYNINSFGTRPAQHWGTTTNTADAYQIKPVPSFTSYSSDLLFSFTPHLDNNADCTFAVFQEGTISTYLSALTMKKYDMNGSKVNLEDLDLQAGQTYIGRIDTTDVVVLNPDKPKFRNATINELLQVNKILNFQLNSQTISSGTVAYTQVLTNLQAETGTTDDFDGFTGGSPGDIAIITTDTGDTLTMKHSASFDLRDQLDFKLRAGNETLTMRCKSAGNWVEIARTSIDDFRSGTLYEYLPNNKLKQYGKYAGGSHAPQITFPITFDSAPEFVCGMPDFTTAGTLTSPTAQPPTTTGLKFSQFVTGGGTSTFSFWWIAIGTKAQ